MNRLRLTVPKKKLILQLKENGLSCPKMAQLWKRSQFTISSFLKRHRETLEKESKEIRVKPIDTPTREQIEGFSKSRKPLNEIRVDFNALNCVKLSKTTVGKKKKVERI